MRRSTLIAAVVALSCLVAVFLLSTSMEGHHDYQRGRRLLGIRIDVANLSQAVGLYRDDPTESQGLEALLSGPPPRIDKLPNDPWGEPYIYRQTASKPGFEIHSAGRNGLDEGGAGDDVTLADKIYRCEDYQVNCGLTADMVWPLVVAAVFLIRLLCSGCCRSAGGLRRAAHRGKADEELCSRRRWMSQGPSPPRPGGAVRPLREPANSHIRPIADLARPGFGVTKQPYVRCLSWQPAR